jgi:GNAT superfamily N-acetyltransferase
MKNKVDQAGPSSHLPVTFELMSFDGNDRPDLLDEIGTLRVDVWKATGIELTLPLLRGRWLDKADETARHFAVRHNGRVVAASRLNLYREFTDIPDAEWYTSLTVLPSFPVAEITRLVVAPEYQHQGLGKALDEECIATARTWSAGCVFCDVPEYRIGPLTRRGFQIVQEPKPGIRFPTVRWTAMILDLQPKAE